MRVNSIYNDTAGTATIDDIINPDRYTEQINTAIADQAEITNQTIQDRYDASVALTNSLLNEYKAQVGQYMKFGDDGLVLGAKTDSGESPFTTTIDNQGMYFKDGDTRVSWVTNEQFYMKNAVVAQGGTLTIGNFFFSQHDDGSVSLTWQND